MARLIVIEDFVWDGTISRGGQTMFMLEWLQGLERLGHEVLFLDLVRSDFREQRERHQGQTLRERRLRHSSVASKVQAEPQPQRSSANLFINVLQDSELLVANAQLSTNALSGFLLLNAQPAQQRGIAESAQQPSRSQSQDRSPATIVGHTATSSRFGTCDQAR